MFLIFSDFILVPCRKSQDDFREKVFLAVNLYIPVKEFHESVNIVEANAVA